MELEKEFPAICAKLFDTPFLLVKEYRPNEHYHFQGWTHHSLDRFKELTQEEITQKHRYRKEQPDSRLCVHSGKLVDQTGFQYMVKQEHCLVMATTFTKEELDGLKVKSDEHREKLKNGLKEHLWKKYGRKIRDLDTISPLETRDALKKLIDELRAEIAEWSYTNKKDIRTSQMKDRAVNAILHYVRTSTRVRRMLGTI